MQSVYKQSFEGGKIMGRLGAENKHKKACCSFGLGRRTHVGRDNRGSVGDGLWISAGKYRSNCYHRNASIDIETHVIFKCKYKASVLSP